MKIIAALFLAASLPLCAATFNVRDLGATGDGATLDTAAIQKAFDSVKKSGGTIIFPAGNYISAPLVLKGSHITVQLDEGATLSATTNHALFLKHTHRPSCRSASGCRQARSTWAQRCPWKLLEAAAAHPSTTWC